MSRRTGSSSKLISLRMGMSGAVSRMRPTHCGRNPPHSAMRAPTVMLASLWLGGEVQEATGLYDEAGSY